MQVQRLELNACVRGVVPLALSMARGPLRHVVFCGNWLEILIYMYILICPVYSHWCPETLDVEVHDGHSNTSFTDTCIMSGLRMLRVTGSIDACTDLLDPLQTQSLLELTVEATLFDDFGLHEPFAYAIQLKLAALGLDTLHAMRLHHENQFISVQGLDADPAVRFTLYLRLSQYEEAYALVTVFEACQAYLESVKKLACINLDLRVNAAFWMAVFSLFPTVEELEPMGFNALVPCKTTSRAIAARPHSRKATRKLMLLLQCYYLACTSLQCTTRCSAIRASMCGMTRRS